MSRINEKLGMKPQTTKRKATHAAAIVSHAQCPQCGGRHVVAFAPFGVRKRMCAACSHSWPVPA